MERQPQLASAWSRPMPMTMMAALKPCRAVAMFYLLFSLQPIAAQDEDISIFDIEGQFPGVFEVLRCYTPCNGGFTGNEVIPGTGCVYYHECWEGEVRSRKGCGSPLLFNTAQDYCDFPTNFICYDDVQCPPDTPMPIDAPETLSTPRPSPRPTIMDSSGSDETTPIPTMQPVPLATPRPTAELDDGMPPTTDRPTFPQPQPPAPEPPATVLPTSEAPTNAGGDAMAHIESKRRLIEEFILISYTSGVPGLANPSRSYTYDNLMQSLQTMSVDGFGAPFKFDLWQGNEDKFHYGLVNLAAFLANAMVETIQYDSCDELNWQHTSDRYAIANSCGMEGRSYQDETCDMEEDIHSCAVIPEMKMTSNSAAAEARAPPPLECQPGTGQGNYAGYWDAIGGFLIASAPYSNDIGRIDTEGCCWWGRGALLSRGVCSIGKINYFLGKGGADLGRATLYPSIDFCEFPQATCASVYSEELRWTVALFDWSERIQRYASDGWQYEEKLMQFVDGGMRDDSFIDSVSRILSRGCLAPGCSELEVRELDRRRSNFYLIVNDIFDVNRILNPPDPTRQPTPWPTPRPTRGATAIAPTPRPVPLYSYPPETARPITPPPSDAWEKNPSPTALPTINGRNPPANDELIKLDGNSARKLTALRILAASVPLALALTAHDMLL